jgi:hypothetical protein
MKLVVLRLNVLGINNRWKGPQEHAKGPKKKASGVDIGRKES